MIYISGPLVGITHECYFMVVDLDLLTCGIVDASATCSWASSPLGMIMALTEHRFHPFSLSFSATWLSPSSHRVTAKSYTDLRRMELERGKKCADAQMLVPSHARKTQLISQAARTCENTDFTTNITTWFPDCGQTLPWGGARPVSIRHFFFCETKFSTVRWKLTLLDMVHGSTFCSVFAAVGSFEALSGLSFGPLWVLRDSEPPGVARNAAKTLGSLKSLTLKFKALVLHNLDWAESSSIIKVICNHWDYLYRFVGIALFSSIVMLWDLQGGYGWLQDEHVDWDARAHKREELRFCLMQDFVFFPDSRLCCETHICLHLPTACFSPSNARSNQTREICSCFIDEGRGLCLVLVSPIDFWPCRFLSSRFPKLLAVSWLDIHSACIQTRIRCLAFGLACPQAIAEVKPVKVSVPSAQRSS